MTDTRSALKIRKDVGGMNMTEQHTPGPWRADNLGKVRSIYDDGKGLVADCGDGRYALPRDSNICHANARLIAAAPETTAERDRLREVNAELIAALEELAHRAARVNEVNHAGREVPPLAWADLYQATNEARAVLAAAKGE